MLPAAAAAISRRRSRKTCSGVASLSRISQPCRFLMNMNFSETAQFDPALEIGQRSSRCKSRPLDETARSCRHLPNRRFARRNRQRPDEVSVGENRDLRRPLVLDQAFGREEDGDRGSGTDDALEFQPPVMELHQTLRQRQANAGTLIFAAQAAIVLAAALQRPPG